MIPAIVSPSGIVNDLTGIGVDAVFDAASHWVASGASWILDQVGAVLGETTTPPVATSWFGVHESLMATLAAAVILPMVCCAAMQSVLRQSPSTLARSVLLYLPLALLLTGVCVELVSLGLALTDALSAKILAAGGVDTRNLLQPLSQVLVGSSVTGPAIPTFVLFVAALLVAVAALALWLELVIRSAAVTAATLFLPLALAALVWPAVSHWCRRLADTLVALVLSKLVVAAVLSLAAGALAGGLGTEGSGGGGISSVVTGVALLVVATVAPFTLLRLVPAFEAGAVSHLESARHRINQAAHFPQRATNLAIDTMKRAQTDEDGASTTSVGALRMPGSGGAGAGAASGSGAGASGLGAASGLGVAVSGLGAGMNGVGVGAEGTGVVGVTGSKARSGGASEALVGSEAPRRASDNPAESIPPLDGGENGGWPEGVHVDFDEGTDRGSGADDG